MAIVTDGQVSCDELLEEQLVAQRGANNGGRMNEIIRLIQQRQECSPEIWNPEVIPGAVTAVAAATAGTAINNGCWDATAFPVANAATIGGTNIPIGLAEGNALSGKVLNRAYRDPSNNILVYFNGLATRRPGDSSRCWLYVSRLRSWSRGY